MKLSIITINYNNLEGLKKTVDSVLSQTWRDFEWIIVDGGSTDGSKEYIECLAQSLSAGTAIDSVQWNVERFSLLGFTAEDLKGTASESVLDRSSADNRPSPIANHPQRLLWCSESDKGVYNAMNKGIAMAKGEYCLFLNSGDNLHCVDSLTSVFETNKNADVLYGDLFFMTPSSAELFVYPDILTLHYLLSRSLGHPASFIKTSIMKVHGYREDFHIVSDWYKFIELYRAGGSFYHIRVPVSDFDTAGISNTDTEVVKKETEALYSSLFGKENRQWVEETVQLHFQNELCEKNDVKKMLQLYQRGGIRRKALHYFLRLLSWI